MRIEHGGALDRAIAKFGGRAEDWLDLSTGINPEAFSLPELPTTLWNRLPDDGLQQSMLRSARSYYSVPDGAALVAASGTQALIQIVPELAATGEACIISPTYQEHQASFERVGWTVSQRDRIEDVPASAKVVVIVNPNNPDGRIAPIADLVRLAQKMAGRGGFLLVDEAFSDPHPETSIVRHAGMRGLVILKSFGKFFGLAGVRLGFAVGEGEVMAQLAARIGPWAVSGPALAIARHAFTGGEERAEFTERLRKRRLLLSAALDRQTLREIGGTMLFSLVEHQQAHALWGELARRHVLVRKFDYAPHWLRVGLPLDEAECATFEDALAASLAGLCVTG